MFRFKEHSFVVLDMLAWLQGLIVQLSREGGED
jgi:hypothetical protein